MLPSVSPGPGSAQLRDKLLAATSMAAVSLMRGTDDAAFREALRVLGEAAEVSRVFVFEIGVDAQGRTLCWQRHEWCAPGVTPQIDNAELQGFPMEGGFGRWLRLFEADQPVFGEVADFPAEERTLLEAQSIVSLVVMPVEVDQKLWGFIGFDECHNRTKWTREVIDCLRITARVLAGAIDRMNYRRRRDEVLADHEQLIDSLDDVVFRFDAQGRWTFLSPAWQRRLGWTPAECLGRPAVRYVQAADRAQVLRSWKQVIAGRQQSFRGEVRFHQHDGGERWMLVSARAQHDRHGTMTGVTGTLTDITAAKIAEAELIAARTAAEQANKAKSEFLSTMSHELRTPLNAVIGLAESLLEAEGRIEPARSRRYLEVIHASGRQLLVQINDILDFVRLESGRIDLQLSRCDLGGLAGELIEALQPKLRAKSLSAEIELSPSAVHVNADERLLRQALQNLLSNAVKFTPANGHIAVRVEQAAGGAVTIAVRDSGIGIAADQQDRLFRPFSQIDASLSRQYGGTGLGLSLVERIVRLHGGRVSVASAPGAGSTFAIELPASALVAPPAPRAIRRPGMSRCVLVVDDDVNQHTLVGDYLRRHGLEVVRCERAEVALNLALTRPPAVVLVDIQLPGMSGLELIRRLRATAETRAVAVLAVTAHAAAEDAQRCHEAGADAFLAKPVSLRELARHIHELTGLIP